MPEKYLDFTGLSRYDAKIKEVIQKDLASVWAVSTAYTVGQYVVYNGLLYQCKTAHTSTSTFDSTKWNQVKVTDLINDVKTTVSTAVQAVNGTNPVSASKSGTTVTISLINGYGDTSVTGGKNPYTKKGAHLVLAGNGTDSSNAEPSFRELAADDIPNLPASKITSGTIPDDRIASASTWNAKQNALATQPAYSAVGGASKVPIITTNTLGQVTAITTADIVSANNGKLTINGATPTTGTTPKIEFTANQSGDVTGTIDSTFVGLGSVVNTGDSSTPAENGVEKFTTGGAYALKASLEEMIRTQAAHFRGSWTNWAEVPSNANYYPVDSDGNRTPTANDYMIVDDASDYPVASGTPALSGTWQFVYTGVWSTTGKSGWQPGYKIESPTITFKTINSTNTSPQQTSASETLTGSGTINLHKISKTGSYNDLTDKPTIPVNTNQKIKSGNVTFGDNDVINFVGSGSISVSGNDTDDTITITGSNYYPTEFTWSDGTTAGPTGSLSVSGTNAVSFGAIPSASASVSGIVTTGDQTFAGVKTFSQIKINSNNGIAFVDGTTYKTALLIGSGDRPQYKKTTGTAADLALYSDLPNMSLYVTLAGDESISGVKYFADGSLRVGTSSNYTNYKKATIENGSVVLTLPTTSGTLALAGDIPESFTITANATDGIFDLTGTSGNNAVTYALAPYSGTSINATWVGSDTNAGKFYLGTINPAKSTRLNYNGYLYATKLYSGGNEVLTAGDVNIPVSDVKIGTTKGNAVTCVDTKIAYLLTYTAYNESTNKLATMSDIPSISLTSSSVTGGTQVQWGLKNTTVSSSITFIASGTGDTAKNTTTLTLGETSVAFESITKSEIDTLFT